MQEKFGQLSDEFWQFIVKTLPISLAALAISISVQIKNKTATVINVVLSIISGISCAYLTGGFIFDKFGSTTAPIVIGVVTIAGEKIAYWLIYKFEFDRIGEAGIRWTIKRFKK